MDFVCNDAVPLVGLICSLLGHDHAKVTFGTSMTVSFGDQSSTINTASSRNRHTSPRKIKRHDINHFNGMRVASRSTISGRKRNGDNVHSDLKREVSESIQQTGCDDDAGSCHERDVEQLVSKSSKSNNIGCDGIESDTRQDSSDNVDKVWTNQEADVQSCNHSLYSENTQRSKGVTSLASYLLRRKEQALQMQNKSEDNVSKNTKLKISKEGCTNSVCEKSNCRNDSTQDGDIPLEWPASSANTFFDDHMSSHTVTSTCNTSPDNHCQKNGNDINLDDNFTIQFGEKVYKCTYCDKVFYELGRKNAHERIHNGGKRFQCSFCDNTFSSLGNLHDHERIHIGIKSHKCSICGKAFFRGTALVDHIRTHTGEKPFKCTICDKAFAVSCSLRRHERVHSGERPYMCCTCGKRFIVSGALKKHMRVHTGERPYKCITCGKAFSCSTHLRTHERVHRKNMQEHDFLCENITPLARAGRPSRVATDEPWSTAV